MSHLPVCGKDLEASATSPKVMELPLLGVPAIMVAGVIVEGTPGLAKVFKRNWAFNLSGIKADVARNIVPPDQVVAFDVPLILNVIHHDEAIFKVPARWKLGVVVRDVNLHVLVECCIINRSVTIR